jgi:hypothetical protein
VYLEGILSSGICPLQIAGVGISFSKHPPLLPFCFSQVRTQYHGGKMKNEIKMPVIYSGNGLGAGHSQNMQPSTMGGHLFQE